MGMDGTDPRRRSIPATHSVQGSLRLRLGEEQEANAKGSREVMIA